MRQKRENRRPDAFLVFFLKRKKEPLADMKVPEDNVKEETEVSGICKVMKKLKCLFWNTWALHVQCCGIKEWRK